VKQQFQQVITKQHVETSKNKKFSRISKERAPTKFIRRCHHHAFQ
jgi:hypothetical protein